MVSLVFLDLLDELLQFLSLFGASLVAQKVKNLPAKRRLGFDLWVRKIPWRRARQPTPVLLPGESHGKRDSPGELQTMGSQSDTTEHNTDYF